MSTPHIIFFAQGIEERMVAPFDDAHEIVGTSDAQAGSFAAGLASSVYRNQEVMVPAFDVERDFPFVAYHDGADVEAVRSYGGEADGAALGHKDRSLLRLTSNL